MLAVVYSGQFFLITEVAHTLVLLFQWYSLFPMSYFRKNMGWATFWAIFTKIPLVTPIIIR
jgi:hypothetical protein